MFMQEQKVSILNSHGEKLAGLETKATKPKQAAIILVHGFAATKEEYYQMFDDLAKIYSDAGFLVFRFDFSGCGESEGTFTETSLTKMASEVKDILAYVRGQPHVDTDRIGILGQSFGTCAVIAAEPQVKCLILMGSVANPKERALNAFRADYHPTGLSTRMKSHGPITVGPAYWKSFEKEDISASLKKITCPILFVYGNKDITVPPENTEILYSRANEPKMKIPIEGADHNYRGCEEIMHATTLAWFQKWNRYPDIY